MKEEKGSAGSMAKSDKLSLFDLPLAHRDAGTPFACRVDDHWDAWHAGRSGTTMGLPTTTGAA
jgi:hypothetical protein